MRARAYQKGRDDQRREQLVRKWEKQLTDVWNRILYITARDGEIARGLYHTAHDALENVRTSMILTDQEFKTIEKSIELAYQSDRRTGK